MVAPPHSICTIYYVNYEINNPYSCSDKCIRVDIPLPKLGKLFIEGVLDFSVDNTDDIELEADYILITGRLIAGLDADNPYTGNLLIRLRGDHDTPVYPSNGVNLGSKFIGNPIL